MKNFIESFKNKKYLTWFILFCMSLFGVILSIVVTFTHWERYIENGVKIVRPHWKTEIMYWFHFTFQSNMLAVIISSLVIFGKIDIGNKHFQRAKTMMAVSLLVTCVIFWTLLVHKLSTYTTLGIVSTVFVHALTPTLAIFTFFFDGHKTEIKTEDKAKPWVTMLLITIFPILWLICAIIIYYSLGADASSAIYNFLDFNRHLTEGIIVISGLSVVYPCIAYLFQWIYNK